MSIENKRKTHTSTAVKRRYNAKTYTQLAVYVPKDTAEAFREKCKREGIPQAQILKEAIDAYLKQAEKG